MKLLVADCFRPKTTSFRGAWLGDPVILASDDYGLPDIGGLITATSDDPRRNLNAMAKAEFTDISYRALAELCLDRNTAEELAERSSKDPSLLIDLVAVLEQYHTTTLEMALNAAVGEPWRKGLQSGPCQGPLARSTATHRMATRSTGNLKSRPFESFWEG